MADAFSSPKRRTQPMPVPPSLERQTPSKGIHTGVPEEVSHSASKPLMEKYLHDLDVLISKQKQDLSSLHKSGKSRSNRKGNKGAHHHHMADIVSAAVHDIEERASSPTQRSGIKATPGYNKGVPSATGANAGGAGPTQVDPSRTLEFSTPQQQQEEEKQYSQIPEGQRSLKASQNKISMLMSKIEEIEMYIENDCTGASEKNKKLSSERNRLENQHSSLEVELSATKAELAFIRTQLQSKSAQLLELESELLFLRRVAFNNEDEERGTADGGTTSKDEAFGGSAEGSSGSSMKDGNNKSNNVNNRLPSIDEKASDPVEMCDQETLTEWKELSLSMEEGSSASAPPREVVDVMDASVQVQDDENDRDAEEASAAAAAAQVEEMSRNLDDALNENGTLAKYLEDALAERNTLWSKIEEVEQSLSARETELRQLEELLSRTAQERNDAYDEIEELQEQLDSNQRMHALEMVQVISASKDAADEEIRNSRANSFAGTRSNSIGNGSSSSSSSTTPNQLLPEDHLVGEAVELIRGSLSHSTSSSKPTVVDRASQTPKSNVLSIEPLLLGTPVNGKGKENSCDDGNLPKASPATPLPLTSGGSNSKSKGNDQKSAASELVKAVQQQPLVLQTVQPAPSPYRTRALLSQLALAVMQIVVWGLLLFMAFMYIVLVGYVPNMVYTS